MIRVQPIYKCRACGEPITGPIMQLANRSLADLLVDVMDMAEPMAEPHNCDKIKKMYGAWEYVGFYITHMD